MPGIYRPRHPERTVLYRVLFHHFEQFIAEYERRFEREYGYFRPIVKEVVEHYLDCGNPKCGFARIRCPGCRAERLLTLSCKTRCFCPSCHAKRIDEIRTRINPRVGVPRVVRLNPVSMAVFEKLSYNKHPEMIYFAKRKYPGV